MIPAGFRCVDLLRCAERECRLRERVYPRWVQLGRMSNADAVRELAAMQAIRDLLRALADAAEQLRGGQPALTVTVRP
jgi:hypothetical protein